MKRYNLEFHNCWLSASREGYPVVQLLRLTRPLQLVKWNLVGALEGYDDQKWLLLVLADIFTKGLEVIPFHDTASETLAEVFLRE